jgi:hypothetical protein
MDVVVRIDAVVGGSTNVYMILTNGANGVNASTGATETLNSSNWAACAIAMTDPNSVQIFQANVPVNTNAGQWTPVIFEKSGTPAPGDPNIAAGDPLAWNGTEVIDLLSLFGTGNTAVNENTGGTGNLLYQYLGVGIAGATIRAYLTSDFNAGNFIIQGQTTTNSLGGFAQPLFLQSGASYTLTWSYPTLYQEVSAVISI